MRASPIAWGLAMALASAAHADHLTQVPEYPTRPALSARISANLNDYTDDFTLTLEEMTLGLLDMKFDLHRKVARLRLGGGDPHAFRLVFDSDVLMQRGQARVQSRVDLAIAGHGLSFSVPRFDLTTESVRGERALELSIPVFEGHF